VARVVNATDGLDGPWRHLVSQVCRWLVWLVRPRLWGVRDPLAGFFAVRRDVLAGVVLRQGLIFLEHLLRLATDRGPGVGVGVVTSEVIDLTDFELTARPDLAGPRR